MAFRLALLLCFSLCLSLVAACARTTFKDSVADQYGAADANSEMDFWDDLVTRTAVTNNDALHALVLSFDDGEAADFDGRVAVARERGWLALNEDLAPNESARVGLIARAVCIEADIQGGVTMRVFGPRERYAVLELNYLEWLPEMSRFQSISGAKLIALLGSVEDHLASAPDEPSTIAAKEDA